MMMAVSLTGAAQSRTAPQMFENAAGARDVRPGRAATRSRVVAVRTDLLAAADRQPDLTLALFPDAVFRVTHSATDVKRPGQYVWQGQLAGVEDGHASFAVTDGVVVGQVSLPGAQYQVRPAGAGLHVIEQVDTSRLPREGAPRVPDLSAAADAAPAPGTATDDGSIIDVMVVYTPAARLAAGGPSAIASVINLSVTNANNAYANSGVTQRLRLVYSAEVNYSESASGMESDLDRLTAPADAYMDGVHALRDTYRADFVTLLTDAYDYCGIGWLMTTVSASFAPYAFNVTSWDCAGPNLSMAHELGHNMGLHHDISNAGGQAAYPYAYGYRDEQQPNPFRTVMAYECGSPGCPRVQHFSTHTRTYGGRPTGVADASENARALNNTASTTANFRASLGNCTVTLSRNNLQVPAGGGYRGIYVMTNDPSCSWEAYSNASFLSADRSTGSGLTTLVQVYIEPSAGSSPRTGSITFGGVAFTITQTLQRTETDFTGDGIPDLSVFRPGEGRFYTYGIESVQWGQAGDVPITADYDGDGRADYAVYRPSTGTWFVRNGPTVAWGAPGDIPVPADYNGDGRVDIAVYRPSTGQWFLRSLTIEVLGSPGDIPVPADYDGDGRAEPAVWTPATGMWRVLNGTPLHWGAPGDIPVPGQWDSNRRGASFAVYRPSTATWFVKDVVTYVWGWVGDLPVPLDRNKDGNLEFGIFRPSTNEWHFIDIYRPGGTPAIEIVTWGGAGDIPLNRASLAWPRRRGDFDGDRRADHTVFRPATGSWFARRSSANGADYIVRTLGTSGDIPLTGDWDSDGYADAATFTPSSATWQVQPSGGGAVVSLTWGAPGDTPVPGDYDGDNRTDYATFTPPSGGWKILLSSTSYTGALTLSFGQAGDIPVARDYDGDRRTDLAVFRPGTGAWYFLDRASMTYWASGWGTAGDIPVSADYDGDGIDDRAVYRPSTGRWYILLSSRGSAAPMVVTFGVSTDVPVPADYDGDGSIDIAVYRPDTGHWFVYDRFRGTYSAVAWGLGGDVPVLKAQ